MEQKTRSGGRVNNPHVLANTDNLTMLGNGSIEHPLRAVGGAQSVEHIEIASGATGTVDPDINVSFVTTGVGEDLASGNLADGSVDGFQKTIVMVAGDGGVDLTIIPAHGQTARIIGSGPFAGGSVKYVWDAEAVVPFALVIDVTSVLDAPGSVFATFDGAVYTVAATVGEDVPILTWGDIKDALDSIGVVVSGGPADAFVIPSPGFVDDAPVTWTFARTARECDGDVITNAAIDMLGETSDAEAPAPTNLEEFLTAAATFSVDCEHGLWRVLALVAATTAAP